MQKKEKIKISIIISILLVLLGIFSITSNLKSLNHIGLAYGVESTKDTISITIIAGDQTVNVSSYRGASLYDALLSAEGNKQITFSGKNYPGLGFFVTDIDSLHDGNGKNLIYYINDKEATVGVSTYIINTNDVILWKLE